LKLLFRFYDPDSGLVSIDGQRVDKVTTDSLRTAIGVIPQDTVLFNNTVFFNIAYGNRAATKEQVLEASNQAEIHQTISGMT